MHLAEFVTSLPAGIRILAGVFLAFLGHFIVRELKRLSQWLLTLKLGDEAALSESFSRRYPKIAGITTILVLSLIHI